MMTKILCPACDDWHEVDGWDVSDGGMSEWECPGCKARFEITTDFAEVEEEE